MPSKESFIRIVDNVLPEAMCKQLVEQFDLSKHAMPGATGGGIDTDKKRSLDISLNHHAEFNPILQTLLPLITEQITTYFEQYLFALIGAIGLTINHPDTGLPVKLTQQNFAELGKPNLAHLLRYLFRYGDINAQKYQQNSGGYPYWHSEVFPQIGENVALHRILLFMFYLNDVPVGGETEFYYQQEVIKPKMGRMVIAPAYFTHTHRGNVPVSNDKYILTSWVLFNPAEKIYQT